MFNNHDREHLQWAVTLLESYADTTYVNTGRLPNGSETVAPALFADVLRKIAGFVDGEFAHFAPDDLAVFLRSRGLGSFEIFSVEHAVASVYCGDIDDALRRSWPISHDRPTLLSTYAKMRTAARAIDRATNDQWQAIELEGDSKDVPSGLTDLFPRFNMSWQLRETCRAHLRGHAYHLPWSADLPPIPGHFAAISPNDPEKLRFVADERQANADRKTVIKPGRYLAQFYPHLDPQEVRRYQAMLMQSNKLMWAETSDEIVAIYAHCGGTSEAGKPSRSCMGYKAENFEDGHPCRVYGSGSDLVLAYIKSTSGEIAARALVWKDKRIVGRIYGDEDRLIVALESLGFKRGSLSGAKVHRIKAKGHGPDAVIMPYIDVVQRFDVLDDDWLLIGTGSYDAASTDGVSYTKAACSCCYCDEGVDEDDVVNVHGDYYCQTCADARFTICDRSGEYVDRDNVSEVVTRIRNPWNTTQTWSSYYVENYAFFCDRMKMHYSDDIPSFSMENGETWSREAFAKFGVEVDGKYYVDGEEPVSAEDAEAHSGAA